MIEEDFFLYSPKLPFHVIIACCFADLFSPNVLVDQLVRISKGALAYLPITFSGQTKLLPVYEGDESVCFTKFLLNS